MTYSRHQESKLLELLNFFPVVLVLGVRQCGKTTLVKQLKPDWAYFDLQNSSDREFVSRDYDFFFSQNSEHVIIDEAQELPQLFKNLRGEVDLRDAPKKDASS